MKAVGYALIAAGFLAGALISVVHADQVAWARFGVALAAGFAGIALVRIGHEKAAGGPGAHAAGVQQLADTLQELVSRMKRLNDEKGQVNTYDVRHRIDSLIVAHVDDFAAGRQSIGRACGLAAYADIMGHFAAGERYLNRVWSASADGYVDEVNASLEKSQDEFDAALRLLHDACRQTA